MIPGLGIFFLLLGTWLPTGRVKSFSRIAGSVIVLVFAFPVCAKTLAIPIIQQQPSITQLRIFDPDVILVPTAGASQSIHGIWTVSENTLSRADLASRIQVQFGIPVIVSGGDPVGAGVSEATLVTRQNVVKLAPVILENKATNTAESAIGFARLLKEHGFSRPLLITDSMHMSRMQASLRRYDVHAMGYAVKTYFDDPVHWRDFLPGTGAYSVANQIIRTYGGLVYYLVSGHFELGHLIAALS